MGPRTRSAWLVATLLAGAAVSGPVGAQDPTDAAALFEKGLADMKAGRHDTGCPAIAQSHKLDPRPGTVFTLAECENQAGKVASAQAHYDEYLRMFTKLAPEQQKKQHGREIICAQQLEAIRSAVPHVTVVLTEPAPAGTVVRRDGMVIEPSSLGVALPVDPGEHEVTIETLGEPARSTRFALGRGESKHNELSPRPDAAAPADGDPEGDDGGAMDAGGALRVAGAVVGGLGLVTVVVGAVTGGLALGAKSTVDENCNGSACNQDGLDASKRMENLANASTGCLIAGGVALVAGIVMLVVAPRVETSEASSSTGLLVRPALWDAASGGLVAGIEASW